MDKALHESIAEALVEICWVQWRAMAPSAVGGRRDSGRRVIVDPEALVLGSLVASEHERRLADLTAGWGRSAAHLMSVARMRRMTARFPRSAEQLLPIFADGAVEGGEVRWRSIASKASGDGPPVRSKDIGPVSLTAPALLMLRMRAGFGTSTKADLLTVLIGRGGDSVSLKELAYAAAAGERAIRNAVAETVAAGFCEELPGRPSSFRIHPPMWRELLLAGASHSGGFPEWMDGAGVLAFLADCLGWARAGFEQNWSEYVSASRGRDLLESHASFLRRWDPGRPALRSMEGSDPIRLLADQVASIRMDSMARLAE